MNFFKPTSVQNLDGEEDRSEETVRFSVHPTSSILNGKRLLIRQLRSSFSSKSIPSSFKSSAHFDYRLPKGPNLPLAPYKALIVEIKDIPPLVDKIAKSLRTFPW